MARSWREGTTELIISCLVLELLLFAYQLYDGGAAGSQLGTLTFWSAIDILLLWRIWRGGRAAWTILAILDAFALAELLFGLTWPWNLHAIDLFAIVAAQTALPALFPPPDALISMAS